jgi:predicted nucleotidyltransferase
LLYSIDRDIRVNFLITYILPVFKDTLDINIIRSVITTINYEDIAPFDRYILSQYFINNTYIDELDNELIKTLLSSLSQEYKDNLILDIIPLMRGKINNDTVEIFLKNVSSELKGDVIYLVNKYKQQVNENIVINEIVPSEVPTKTIKFSNQLNSKLWDKDELLKPEVRIAILKISKKYIESIDKKIKFKDIVLTGSIANYNYNELSDLDIHIVVDYKNIGDNEDLLLKYFKGIKDDWSNKYKLTIYGYPVEIFIQNERTPIESAAVYSVLNNKWIQKPEHNKPDFNIKEIKNIAAKFINKFDDLQKYFKVNKDYDKALSDIEIIKKEISDMRKVGLDKEGEFSTENLSFKLLRNLGVLDKINTFKEKLINKQLTLKENRVILNKNKKQNRLITETTVQGKTIINVDIQPEYENYISFNLNKWVNFLNENGNNNRIIFLYNGADTMGMISESDYFSWLLDLGVNEDILDNATFYDKGYAFFRYCIDNSIDDNNIVDLVKYMIKHDINDSREINEEMWDNYMEETGHTQQDVRDLLESAGDMINIPDLMDFLKNYSNIVLTGGGINECLKEVEIALLSLDKNFNTLSEFVY